MAGFSNGDVLTAVNLNASTPIELIASAAPGSDVGSIALGYENAAVIPVGSNYKEYIITAFLPGSKTTFIGSEIYMKINNTADNATGYKNYVNYVGQAPSMGYEIARDCISGAYYKIFLSDKAALGSWIMFVYEGISLLGSPTAATINPFTGGGSLRDQGRFGSILFLTDGGLNFQSGAHVDIFAHR